MIREPVSFAADWLIRVDSADRTLGFERKDRCHEGAGRLHRAFSVFLVDAAGRVLLQQRSAGKLLWPGFWSNSCCSHPRRGETVAEAARRRVHEELGLHAALEPLFAFEYRASYLTVGSEYELCHVLVGRAAGEPAPHPDEVADWRFVPAGTLDRELHDQPERYTPWLRLEWQRLRAEHGAALRRLGIVPAPDASP